MRTKILKIAAIVLLMAGSTSCQKQELNEKTDFYYAIGKEGYYEEHLTIRKDKVIVKCKSEDDAKALEKQIIFKNAYTVGDCVIGAINPIRINLDVLLRNPKVLSATYGLEYVDGTLQYPTDRISVKFKEGQTPESALEAAGLTKNVEAIEMFNQWSDLYIITLNVKLGDILRTCRNLFKLGLCEVACPVYIRELNP